MTAWSAEPPVAGATTPSTSGILHLAFGAIGFVSLGVAALLLGRWFARRGEGRAAVWSRVAGLAGLWLAVVAGFAWLLLASVSLYRTVPHPVVARR